MTKNITERPYVGIGVIIVRDGKILLGERLSNNGAGSYQIPGGHLEYGESIVECAKREATEETGLQDIEVKDVVCVNNDVVYDVHYISIGVLTASNSGDPFNTEPEKSQNWTWYDPTNLPSPIFEPSKRVIECWIHGQFCNEIPIDYSA